MNRPERRTALAAAALLAAGFPARGAGPDTHLFEARVPDGKTVVFLPAADIESRDDAAAWLRWAGESLPGGRGKLRAAWDEETIELELFGMAAPGLLHEGDDAVDPAGRVRFVLAETPAPGAEHVRVRLAALPGSDEATPDTMCLTNVWILSRERFFDRCREAADAGRILDARKAVANLLDSGPVHPGTPGFDAWRAAIDDFCSEMPGLEARVVFLNRGDNRLRVRTGGRILDIPPGKQDVAKPPSNATEVKWEAWSEPVRGSEDDYEPEPGTHSWSRFGDDVTVPFDRVVGHRKGNPRLFLPDGAIPPEAKAAGVEAVVNYEASGRPVPAELKWEGSRAYVEIEPRNAVKSVRLSASGWRDAAFHPADGIVIRQRGETAELKGSPMRRDVKPWPEAIPVAIVWNGFVGPAVLRADGLPGISEQTLDPARPEYSLPIAAALAAESDETAAKPVSLKVVYGASATTIHTNVVVRRGERPAVVRFELPRTEVRPSVDTSKVPRWPTQTQIKAARAWLSSRHPEAPGLLMLAESDDKEVRDRAVTLLRALQGFWPVPALENEHTRTLRALTAHLAVCPGCHEHPSVGDPKQEAFRELGWQPDDQSSFCRDTIRYDKRFQWPWDRDMLMSLFAGYWKKECRAALDPGDSGRGAALDKAFKRWRGVNAKKNEQSDHEPFIRAYRHIETCPGCGFCSPFRGRIAKAPDFEARRAALFRGLVQAENAMSDREVDAIVKEFARLEREKTEKGAAQ